MKVLYDNISYKCSKIVTKHYSTSFSFGIKMLNYGIRKHIYNIYGFVRLADEIVDSFHDFEKEILLKKFRKDTFDSIEKKISLNPILNSFQHTVHTFNIDIDYINKFLDSMQMDLNKKKYTEDKYKQYIYGSAEVVGLMCLHVFLNGDKILFDRLKSYAMRLGSAFQKVNFLRDINQDTSELGRIYFPNVSINSFTNEQKNFIEEDIQKDFKLALEGIRQLPVSSRGGVYLAYIYYKTLLNKINNIPASVLIKKRIRINNLYKFILFIKSFIKNYFNLI
ncbi:MAG: phytoene synthase [Flavobacteriales bacterium]|nr:phytoene synthase [Flavobacteriales bacterium]